MPFITGKIQKTEYTEDTALALGDTILAEWLQQFKHKFVYCAYVISEVPVSAADMLYVSIATIEGDIDAKLYAHYSEITGYLWTDEIGKIGGHDLIKIFSDSLDRYGAIIVQEDAIDLMNFVQ